VKIEILHARDPDYARVEVDVFVVARSATESPYLAPPSAA
jgi:hypothetical protein